jgi:hypothetical protein
MVILHSHTVRLAIASPGLTMTTVPRVIKPEISGYRLRGPTLAIA